MSLLSLFTHAMRKTRVGWGDGWIEINYYTSLHTFLLEFVSLFVGYVRRQAANHSRSHSPHSTKQNQNGKKEAAAELTGTCSLVEYTSPSEFDSDTLGALRMNE